MVDRKFESGLSFGDTIHVPGVKARVEAVKKLKAGGKAAAKKATTRKRAPRKKAQPSV